MCSDRSRLFDPKAAGLLTAFTYDPSLTDYPDWNLGAPELPICVQSDDPAWGRAFERLPSLADALEQS